MGFLSDLVGSFTGSTARDAAKEQTKALEQSQDFIRKGVQDARKDVNAIFPQARQSAGQGFQGALDIFSKLIPQQAGLFQQGNVGAQQALLAGLPQMNNAILGAPIDYSSMQPQTLNYNTDFAQGNRAVGYKTPEEQAMETQNATAMNPQQSSLASLLAGGQLTPQQYVTLGGGAGFIRKFPDREVGDIFGNQPIPELNRMMNNNYKGGY